MLPLLLALLMPTDTRAQHDTEAPVFAAPAEAPADSVRHPGESRRRRKAKRRAPPEIDDASQPDVPLVSQPDPVRGVHVTGWAAGSPKFRSRMIRDLKDAGLNAVVIALKEYDGKVFVRGVPLAREIGACANAIPDLPACVADFRRAGIRAIGRIVLFKDNILARKRTEWAVKTPNGDVWRNERGIAWVDPYRRETWDYNLAIASRAAAAGFDEIQFDYVRFPSDGNTRLCRYSRADHSPKTAVANIREFLVQARRSLDPFGARISICLFGMTSSAQGDMGIGQSIAELAEEVDAVYPMMYPSHYRKGELGVKNPNREPFRIIRRSVRDAVLRLGPNAGKLRPYFQDFSLGVRYDAEKVRAQLLAAQRFGVTSWVLWNPKNKYTWSALRHNNRFVWEEPTPSTAAAPAANVIPEGPPGRSGSALVPFPSLTGRDSPARRDDRAPAQDSPKADVKENP
ncbi:MAG: hypothetical protein HY748_04905 [Elusimicrobia bacterium]|nr:hypothetical protein [Elusimicrobiota bacterium]